MHRITGEATQIHAAIERWNYIQRFLWNDCNVHAENVCSIMNVIRDLSMEKNSCVVEQAVQRFDDKNYASVKYPNRLLAFAHIGSASINLESTASLNSCAIHRRQVPQACRHVIKSQHHAATCAGCDHYTSASSISLDFHLVSLLVLCTSAFASCASTSRPSSGCRSVCT